jgi:hypothetical protein
MFIRAFHSFLSWGRWIQSIPSHDIYLRSTLILPSHLHLGFNSDLFPSDFPTKTLYACTCRAYLILLDWIILIRPIYGEEYKLRSSSLCSCLQPLVIPSLSALCSDSVLTTRQRMLRKHKSRTLLSKTRRIRIFGMNISEEWKWSGSRNVDWLSCRILGAGIYHMEPAGFLGAGTGQRPKPWRKTRRREQWR